MFAVVLLGCSWIPMSSRLYKRECLVDLLQKYFKPQTGNFLPQIMKYSLAVLIGCIALITFSQAQDLTKALDQLNAGVAITGEITKSFGSGIIDVLVGKLHSKNPETNQLKTLFKRPTLVSSTKWTPWWKLSELWQESHRSRPRWISPKQPLQPMTFSMTDQKGRLEAFFYTIFDLK